MTTQFILQCVDIFGFGPYMKKWIEIILENRTFCVKNGGYISAEYQMLRGVRQGCPLSPLLFIIAVEMLGIKVRQDDKIKGIKVRVGNCVISNKIKQYADDTTFLLSDMIDFREILSKIKEFSSLSGLYINKTKTYAMKLGARGENFAEFRGIKFVDKIKLLGIHFSNRQSARNLEENWEGKIEKLEKNLTLWSRRHLTLLGKTTIIKTFGISQFVYVMKSI